MSMPQTAVTVSGCARPHSRMGDAYDQVYTLLCGRHPNLRPWHFQWLATRVLYHDLRTALASLRGCVLDVGCGEKPYAEWLRHVEECIGVDIAAGANVDIVITPGQPWPLESGRFNSVLCTQVMEHASDLENLLTELYRVLAAGGTLVVTVPFAYNVHGAPDDYRRFSVYGVRKLFASQYDITALKGQGGIGSTVGVLLLNWVDTSLNRSRATRILKGIMLPAWLLFTSCVNLLGWMLDSIDRTEAFYSNVIMIARKK